MYCIVLLKLSCHGRRLIPQITRLVRRLWQFIFPKFDEAIRSEIKEGVENDKRH